MNRKTSAGSGTLTPKQLKFVAAWQGDVVAAARAAGYRKPESMAYKLMDDPAVANEIRRKQRIMTEESVPSLARGETVGMTISSFQLSTGCDSHF
jgi:phage terminase small subunit